MLRMFFHSNSGLIDLLAIQVTTRYGSEDIDLSEAVVQLLNSVKMGLFDDMKSRALKITKREIFNLFDRTKI